MITSTDLELKSTLTLGTLESNAESIQAFVLERIKDYVPENYIGKVKEAKDDRAVLNNASKTLNARRLELERQYMEPFNKFKSIISDTCKAINEASGKLDEIVKNEEEREKQEKMEQIQEYWDNTGFTLFDVAQVFDKTWLNKGTKLKDVYADIDAKQKKAFDDLKILEKFPQEDVALLKTVYLETLDITAAMQKADQLKANRDRLAREKAEREAIELRKATEQQLQEETADINEECQKEALDDLSSEALGLYIQEEKTPEIQEYALVLKGTFDNLMKVRKFMSENGVIYHKLVETEHQVYIPDYKK